MDDEEKETCWICLEGVEATEASRPACQPAPLHANRLIQPCRCPRVVHSVCLAKWQLSQSGKSEEKFCRFCGGPWPDWQSNLALPGMSAVEPVMSVHFNGQTHMVKVRPGEEGRMAFIADVRRLLRLRDNQEFSITFECKVPGHGMFLDLKGLSSYDAAVFCAAMTAVERQRLAAQRAQKTAAAGAAGATAAAGSSVWPDPMAAPAPAWSLVPLDGNAAPPAGGAGGTGAGGRRALASVAASNEATAAAAAAAAAVGRAAASRGAPDAAGRRVIRTSASGSEYMLSDADIDHPTSREHSGSSLASSSHGRRSNSRNSSETEPPEAEHGEPPRPRDAGVGGDRRRGAEGRMTQTPHPTAPAPTMSRPAQLASAGGEVSAAAEPRPSASAQQPRLPPFSSACEVQSAGAGGNTGGGGGGGAGQAGSSRRKPHRYGRDLVARGAGAGMAGSRDGNAAAVTRGSVGFGAGGGHRRVGVSWLSRVLACAGFGDQHGSLDAAAGN